MAQKCARTAAPDCSQLPSSAHPILPLSLLRHPLTLYHPSCFVQAPPNLVNPSNPIPMHPSLCPPLTLSPLSLKSVRSFQICRHFVTT